MLPVRGVDEAKRGPLRRYYIAGNLVWGGSGLEVSAIPGWYSNTDRVTLFASIHSTHMHPMPKRTRRSSGGTSVSRTLRAASRDAASSTTKDTQALEVAAGRFINTPELRQRVFKLLDHPSLARLARVQKAWTHDVAQLLYYEVGYAQVRSMSRANVSTQFTLL